MAYDKSGVLVVNKPQDMTSHDVVAIVRRTLNTKKVGHTGTLDPMATGVLPICIGKATKIVDFLMDRKKAYRCTMQLGAATDTQDIWGIVTHEAPFNAVTEVQILNILTEFIGTIDQIPPMFSALKIGGKKLVDLAREGVVVKREPRKRTIYAIDSISIMLPQGRIAFTVTCSKGTYIRTLCHDIGIKLGSYAHMTALERVLSEPFTLEESIKLDALTPDAALIPIETALSWMPSLVLPEIPELLKRLSNGVSTDLSEFDTDNSNAQLYRVFIGEVFWGIAERRPNGVFMKKLMIG